MKKKGFKGRCVKRTMSKCTGLCRTYDDIQFAYADVLEKNSHIVSYETGVLMEGLECGEYTSDFVCVLDSGERCVRECVERAHLGKPMTVKLLDASRNYWQGKGVTDWRIVTNAEK